MTLAIAYVASHFFRASNVTIGLDLMRDLGIGPEALGGLTGAFFFGFAAMQIPCGFFFDRFGPRQTVVGMLVLATIGGIIFTLAPSWPVLLTGRVLMGAGFGVMLIGSMVVISRWFPPDRFSTLTAHGPVDRPGRQPGRHDAARLGLGASAGGACSLPPWSSPRSRRSQSGWWCAMRRRATLSSSARARRRARCCRACGEVLRDRSLRPILALNFCNYACTFTVQGLWGGPFLREVHGLSAIEAGNVLFAAVIAYQIGMLVFGPWTGCSTRASGSPWPARW